MSVIILIIANLIPLFGVVFLKWSLFSIMFLYWLENVIIGFWNIFKLAKAQGKVRANFQINDKAVESYSRIGVVGFFIMHYGIFMTVHGAFVFVMFGPMDVSAKYLYTAFFFLFLSHGLSYWYNFIGKKEYLNISISQQMMQPYARLILMHITILIGGLAAKHFGAPIFALVLMVLLKIALDLFSHLKEHSINVPSAKT